MSERWLVTGALGCIGAWVVRVLLDAGQEVSMLDLETQGPRLELAMGEHPADAVQRVAGDIRSVDAVQATFEAVRPTHVVHLAALQLPFCRATPALGAEVNVVGTVNVLEAAANAEVQSVVYASSVAALDALDDGAAAADLRGHAGSLYGVYKRANEGTAHVYWQDRQLPTVGLRPHTVYGPGRDQGLTSQPTAAMQAAVRGEAYHIGFGGRLSMQYVEDVARDFVAAARAAREGAQVVNLAGTTVSVQEIVETIYALAPHAQGSITYGADPLPLAEEAVVERSVFLPAARTSLADGVRRTMAVFTNTAQQP